MSTQARETKKTQPYCRGGLGARSGIKVRDLPLFKMGRCEALRGLELSHALPKLSTTLPVSGTANVWARVGSSLRALWSLGLGQVQSCGWECKFTSLLPRRVRALSVPVSLCVVQRDRSFHPAHVFLTGSSATDGS